MHMHVHNFATNAHACTQACRCTRVAHTAMHCIMQGYDPITDVYKLAHVYGTGKNFNVHCEEISAQVKAHL